MIDFCKLKEPFPPEDIEWRIQQAGAKNGKPWAMVLAYVTNRAIMNRLDEICGPANWYNQFMTGPDGGVLCGISVKTSTEWVTKWDGADKTQVEAVKGGLSGAMKRAAVQWGVGRYLYNLDATFAVISENGKHYQPKNDKKNVPAFKWNPPQLPAWALPDSCKQSEHPQQPPPPDTPKLAVKAQVDKIMQLGKEADVEMNETETGKMIVYYRKGDKLTHAEAEDLINNFQKLQLKYIESFSTEQATA